MLLKKLKEITYSLLPIVLIVLCVHFFFYRFESDLIIKFLFSCILIVVGNVLFLSGVDNSIMPMGELVGNTGAKFKRIVVLMIFAMLFGIVATIAEPDVNVLASEVEEFGLGVTKPVFVFLIGAGVGLFVALALFRIIKLISFKFTVALIIVTILLLACFAPRSVVAIAFDAGGATTGIVTVPFLLAITAGITKNRSTKSHSDNFGVIGIASLGPVMIILILSIIAGAAGEGATENISQNIDVILDTLLTSVLGILPLTAVFYIFDILFLKLPNRKKYSLAFGCLITFTGLFLFMFGINFGLVQMGEEFGKFLGVCEPLVVIVLCAFLGIVITFTEPAVRVLGSQVEDITQGNISRRGVIVAIAISMALAVIVTSLKILFSIDTLYIVIPGYVLIIVLMVFTNSTFAGVSFDSGGVASGPMTATFVLPLMLGFAGSVGASESGFGLIAMVAMMPILVLQIIGVVYEYKIKRKSGEQKRIQSRILYAEKVYSNMDKLEAEYEKYLRDLKKNRSGGIS